jgi:hypothetical protein
LREGCVDFSREDVRAKTSLSLETSASTLPSPNSAPGPKPFRLTGEIADGAVSWAAPSDDLARTALPADVQIAELPVAISTDQRIVAPATASAGIDAA